MKRMDINLPQDGIALFERLLKQTPGTIREYEVSDVSKYKESGRLIVGFRRYSFRYQNKEDKDNLLGIFSRVGEVIKQDIDGEEYNISQLTIGVKDNVS